MNHGAQGVNNLGKLFLYYHKFEWVLAIFIYNIFHSASWFKMQEFMKLTECLSCHWLYEIRTTNIHVNISELLPVIWARMPQLFLNNPNSLWGRKRQQALEQEPGPGLPAGLCNLQFSESGWTYNEEMRIRRWSSLQKESQQVGDLSTECRMLSAPRGVGKPL